MRLIPKILITIAQDQEEYQKCYDSLVLRYETAKKNYDELTEKIEQKEANSERIRRFIKALKCCAKIKL